ncbi:MAG: type 4a pilus biogenesis protein PilO [Phycisphaerae bacterium]
MNTDALVRKGRHIDAVGAGVCLVLTVGLYLAGFCPLAASHEDYAAAEEACAREQDHARNLERTLHKLRARLDTVRSRAEENAVALRPPSTAPLHVAHIARLAAEAGLQVEDMQTGDPKAGAYATTVPVHLAGTGTYQACTRFLRRLRQTLPETCVLAFALQGRPNDTTGAAVLTMDLAWHAALPSSPQAASGGPAADTLTPSPETDT